MSFNSSMTSHSLLPRDVGPLKQRIAGKSIPMEKFVARKARKYFEQGERLVLPAHVSNCSVALSVFVASMYLFLFYIFCCSVSFKICCCSVSFSTFADAVFLFICDDAVFPFLYFLLCFSYICWCPSVFLSVFVDAAVFLFSYLLSLQCFSFYLLMQCFSFHIRWCMLQRVHWCML